MTAKMLDGEAAAAAVKDDLRARIATLEDRGVTPGLGTVLVGDDGPSAKYVAMKHADAAELGMHSADVRLGADATVDPSNGDAVGLVQDLTQGGADLVVECAGHASSLANVFDYARAEGRVSMVGINIGQKFPVELGKIQIKDLTVRGCIGSPGVWPAAIKFLERTGIDLSPIQTHSFQLADALAALELGKDPQAAVKVTLQIA